MRHQCDDQKNDYLEVGGWGGAEFVKLALQGSTLNLCLYTPEHAKEIARDIDAHADKIIAARPKLRYSAYKDTDDRIWDGMTETHFMVSVNRRTQLIDLLNAYDQLLANWLMDRGIL